MKTNGEHFVAIAESQPESFVLLGRDPRIARPDPPDLVFVRDRSVPYLLYRAEANLDDGNPPADAELIEATRAR